MNTLCYHVKDVHDWTTEDKNSMQRLFKHVLAHWPNLAHALQGCQATLVLRAEKIPGFNWRAVAEFDLELVTLTNDGKLDDAMLSMAHRLKRYVDDLWPDCAIPTYVQFLEELKLTGPEPSR